MTWPCSMCGVRPDVACKHRPADPDWQAYEQAKPDPMDKYKPIKQEGNGRNMRRSKRAERLKND